MLTIICHKIRWNISRNTIKESFMTKHTINDLLYKLIYNAF